jgi:hypothetical protein
MGIVGRQPWRQGLQVRHFFLGNKVDSPGESPLPASPSTLLRMGLVLLVSLRLRLAIAGWHLDSVKRRWSLLVATVWVAGRVGLLRTAWHHCTTDGACCQEGN